MSLSQALTKGSVKQVERISDNKIGTRSYQVQYRVHFHNKSPILAYEYFKG